MKEKIALVCQRYGKEVNGGAETHCRQYALRLCAWYDVTVYTTCALDYGTWANEYPAGESVEDGVRIVRYPVKRERNMKAFDRQSELVFASAAHTDADEEKWLDLQGPYAPDLVEALVREQDDYRKIIFFTYLYYITARALPRGISHALLLPTAHDEPPIYLRCYDKVFRAPQGILYNTSEEKAFCEKRFGIAHIPGVIAGVGVDFPQGDLPDVKERFGLSGRFLVYAGRITPSKGCDKMFSYFLEYLSRHPASDLQLALMGKAEMEIPKHPRIRTLGFVSDAEKFAVMRDSFALVLMSEFESLSMIVLESMLMRRPVLVNGKCMVLRGHCQKSGAGLYFTDYFEFEGALDYLLEHPEVYEAMRLNAADYVEENYRWDVILKRVRAMIET